MSTTAQAYYQWLFEHLLSVGRQIKVSGEFHGKVEQIDKIIGNDKTAIITSILDFMVHCATVDITIDTDNKNLTQLFNNWKKNLNTGINLDIPRGLRSFTEQYFRERWRSSLIGLNIKWGFVDGYWLPAKMWFSDGAGIWVRNSTGNLTATKYYLGRPKDKDQNLLPKRGTDIIIRKPYNSWYKSYPDPYLARRGALYHGLFKEKIIEKQAEIVNSFFPYMELIKMGSPEALSKGMAPQEEDFKDMENKVKNLRNDYSEYSASRGLIGAFPYDVNIEHLIPDFSKAVDEKILKPLDKNLLSAMGMIELKGFSGDREEAILNPKVLVEEVTDAVLDYVELLDDVMAMIKEKNQNHRKYNKNEIRLNPGIIKSFITDAMRVMIRSWYDRGLVAKKGSVENTTPFNFETQVNQRDKERREKLNRRCYPPPIINQEQYLNDPSDPGETPEETDEQKPEKKKTEKDIDSTAEIDLITEPMKTIRSIPNEIKELLSKKEQKIFKKAFNEQFAKCLMMQMDDFLREKISLEYAEKKVKDKWVKK